jgi:acetyl-CoA synthase
MSRLVAFAAIQGAYNIVQKAEGKLKEALEKFGPEQKLEFPDTAYYLPIIYSLLGAKIEKLADAEPGRRNGGHFGGGDSRGDPLC